MKKILFMVVIFISTISVGAIRNDTYIATAYCHRGRTASGKHTRAGVVAADPRVHKIGTRLRVEAGRYSGTYTVLDTGGAIKGKRLDLWLPSCREAIKFGRRKVKVNAV